MEGTLVFIDGAYLSLIAKKLFSCNPPSFDIKKFAFGLAKEQNLWCRRIFYYTAPPYQSKRPNREESERKAKYDRFIRRLRTGSDVIIREGRCQKTGDGFKQKGVDTIMAMDLIEEPREAGVKSIIVVTCDTDFAPVLDRVGKKHGVYVVLYYFADRMRESRFAMSNHLLAVCNKKVAISARHFEECAFD